MDAKKDFTRRMRLGKPKYIPAGRYVAMIEPGTGDLILVAVPVTAETLRRSCKKSQRAVFVDRQRKRRGA